MHANLRFKFITEFSTYIAKCQIEYVRYKINACIISNHKKNMSI